ncbi:MAG TPA: hypothetical protein VJ860_18440 [Polyangia bacterium]|jgi:hypothetical protein|nr:hypothetical protein [Polyangia bacterium]
MPSTAVTLVVDPKMRALCVKPYPLHPHGCPNFRKKECCPPQIKLLPDYYDMTAPFWAIWNVFELGKHVAAMQAAHPGWSERQTFCCLYWQPGARKALEAEIQGFQGEHMRDGLLYTRCPEAMGLNVTETLRRVGVSLEWPPTTYAVQVALAGKPLRQAPTPKVLPPTGQLGLF